MYNDEDDITPHDGSIHDEAAALQEVIDSTGVEADSVAEEASTDTAPVKKKSNKLILGLLALGGLMVVGGGGFMGYEEFVLKPERIKVAKAKAEAARKKKELEMQMAAEPAASAASASDNNPLVSSEPTSANTTVVAPGANTFGDAPKVDVPKVDVPKVDVPKVDVPKVDVPKVDVPKVDVPKVDVPKVDVPKMDAPKVDVPKVSTPKSNTLSYTSPVVKSYHVKKPVTKKVEEIKPTAEESAYNKLF